MAPPAKKHRPIRSCLPCRVRRIGCDHTRPSCTTCVKANRPCEYSTAHGEGAASGSQSDGPATVPSRSPTDRSTGSPKELGHLHRSARGGTEYLGASFWGISSKEAPELACFLEDQAYEGPDVANIVESCNHLRYWDGPEHSIVSSLHQEVLRYDRRHGLETMLNELPERRACHELIRLFMMCMYPLVPILHLPSFYEQMDEFWECESQYRSSGVPSGFLAEHPSFLALVFSMLCCGSLEVHLIADGADTAGLPTGKRSRSRLSRRLYRATMQTLTMVGFPRHPTLFSLEAFVMCHVPLIREESERSTSFVSTAFRVGQALGLHRDPSNFKDLSDVEAESRRRLWWHILHKDALSSAASGLPQMMWNRQQHDTAMVSELKDTELQGASQSRPTHAALAPEPRNQSLQPSSLSKQSTPCDYRALGGDADVRQVVSVARFLITNVIRRILSRQTDLTPWTWQEVQSFEADIEQMAVQVRGRITRLQMPDDHIQAESLDRTDIDYSREVDIRQLRDDSINGWGLPPTSKNAVFLAWSVDLLTLMIEKAYCTLYQPLQKYDDERLWTNARPMAISRFHAYTEQYIAICINPSYEPFYWVYPGTYQPLQAVSVLLTDLLDNPKSEESLKSRGLVDEVFSLAMDGGCGVVAERNGEAVERSLPSTGKKAWAMLWLLRRRVWASMGIDPSVVWKCARKHDHNNGRSDSDSSSTNDDNEVESQGLTAGDNFGNVFEEGMNLDDLFPIDAVTDPLQTYQWQ